MKPKNTKIYNLIFLILLCLLIFSVNSIHAETMTYTYDSLNRLTSADYFDGYIDYYYDSSGNIIKVDTVVTDSDGDGILDDGDNSGTIGDTPCTGGNTTNCDDNCINTPNPNQEDTDNNGYGNACDCDLDNDGFVGPNDSTLFGQAWWSSPGDPNWNPNADFDSDGFVGPNDSTILGGRWWTSAPWY